jgi:hypothetical protein
MKAFLFLSSDYKHFAYPIWQICCCCYIIGHLVDYSIASFFCLTPQFRRYNSCERYWGICGHYQFKNYFLVEHLFYSHHIITSQYEQPNGFIWASLFFLQRYNLISECLGNKVLSFFQIYFVTDTINTEYCFTIQKVPFNYEQTLGEKNFQDKINRKKTYNTSINNVMQPKGCYNTTNHFLISKVRGGTQN